MNLRFPNELVDRFEEKLDVTASSDLRKRNRAIAILMKMYIDGKIDIDWSLENSTIYDGIKPKKTRSLSGFIKVNYRLPYDLSNDLEYKCLTQNINLHDLITEVITEFCHNNIKLEDTGHYYTLGEKTKTSKVSKSAYLHPNLYREFSTKLNYLRRGYTIYVSEGNVITMLLDMVMTGKIKI